jgi:hypothetical protein
MNARSVICIALFKACVAAMQVSAQAPAQQEQVRTRSVVKEAYQGGWAPASPTVQLREEELAKDMDVRALEAAAQLDGFRALRNDLLVSTKGHLGPEQKDRLRAEAALLERTAPNSFEAHLAKYYSEFPAAAAFMQLDLATARDRDRTELIGPQLGNAARLDSETELTHWSRAMRTRGNLAPGLKQVADDMLLSMETDAILIAAGEMDAYPLWTRQYADGFRKDVLVIDQRLLVDPAYRQRMWSRTRSRGPVPGSSQFVELLATSTSRPVYLSPALGPDIPATLMPSLYVTGMALRYSSAPFDNLKRLKENWVRLSKTTQAGPLSQNYLLAGSVLLKHYRDVGDESRAAALEHELRGLAKSLGVTDRLIKAGVLLH